MHATVGFGKRGKASTMASGLAGPSFVSTGRPMTSGGLLFSPNQILRTPQNLRRPATQASRGSFEFGKPPTRSQHHLRASLPAQLSPVPAQLSAIEVEQLLRRNIRQNYHDLKQACQNYDINGSLTITRGELRRVLDQFCIQLTTAQFDSVLAKVTPNPNGTITYPAFLDRYAGTGTGSKESWKMTSGHKYSYTKAPSDMGTDVLERQLRMFISGNARNVLKSLRLFDYNRDGKVQKHDLRKVVENYGFKMTDEQFEKFWARYDFHHSGSINYTEFLQKLGVNTGQLSAGLHNTRGSNSNQSNGKQEERIALVNRTDDPTRSMNYQQIEVELRKRLRDNYVNLRKAFMAFDAKRDGFVSLEDLKSILVHFTIPVSDQLFAQLMDRIGFKASHKISWEHFLEKFQDPQGAGNGQTIPIRPNHRVNPIRESDRPMTVPEILSLLRKHVANMYPTFKQAFLKFDENRDGKVTRKELKKVLDKLTIRLSPYQYQGLIQHLDPHNSNAIDYHSFLDMFEERETEEGHKWLDSEHWYNRPLLANLAWETVEEILREKIEEYWKPISQSIVAMDPGKTGLLGYSQMKRLLDRHALPVSDEHFDELWNQCEESPEGKVMVAEFFGNLGVNASPGDLVGVSTQIDVFSDLAEQQRKVDLDSRLGQAQTMALNRTSGMTADEVLVRLKDRMSQKSTSVRSNFLRYCKDRTGKLSTKEFRQVLESFGMYMDDDQFSVLCARVGFNRGSLTYSDFVEGFEDLRTMGPGDEVQRYPNHWYKVLEAKNMTSQEVIAELGDKLRQTFGSMRAAFYKMDDDHDGFVRQRDFRHLFDHMMMIIDKAEFAKIREALDIGKQTKLSFRDFLERFEEVDTEEGHKWLESDHRYNETLDPAQMTADQVHQILSDKAQRQYHDLAGAFRSIDKNKNGVIQRKELRDLLYTFMIPMTKEEFTKLWHRYDIEGKGYIDHQHFLKVMGRAFAPSDDGGTSRRIVDESMDTLETHNNTQMEKQINITLSQAKNSTFMSVDRLEQSLKDRIRDKYGSFQEAFTAMDRSRSGYISVKELQKIMLDHNYLVDDATLKQLLERVGLPSNKSRLSYEEFLRAFDESMEAQYRQKGIPAVQVQSFGSLKPDKASKKLRKMVQANVGILQSAFGAFDKEQRGCIGPSEFRRVLDNFCFKLTEKQFKHLLTKVKVNEDLSISYMAFLEDFSANEQELAQNWIESIQAGDDADPLGAMAIGDSPTPGDVLAELQRCVTANRSYFVERFGTVDYANLGAVSQQDFREALDSVSFDLTDTQFAVLWESLPTNEFGNLEYRAFLEQCDEAKDTVQEPEEAKRLATVQNIQAATRPPTRTSSRLSLFAGRYLSTPLVNAESTEMRLKRAVVKNWHELQRVCKLRDPENTGEVQRDQFADILTNFNILLPAEEFDRLAMKYDLKESGRFSYMEFLKHFVLNLRPASRDQPRGLLSRQKIHPAKVQVRTGLSVSSDMVEAMLRVRQCVENNWKSMRRSFRANDPSASGIISTTLFRQILRQFSINLTEDEFFHLMTYYDKDLSGKISYNDFLRAFLE